MIEDHIFTNTHIYTDNSSDNQYPDYIISRPQTEQHETIHPDPSHLSDETLQQVQQQNQNTITFATTLTIPDQNTTDTHSFTITTDSDILYIPTRRKTETNANLFQSKSDTMIHPL